MALSPDGRRFLSGSGLTPRGDGFYQPAGEDFEPRLWDVESGLELHRFRGHTTSVMGVALTADGRHAFSASTDQTVRM